MKSPKGNSTKAGEVASLISTIDTINSSIEPITDDYLQPENQIFSLFPKGMKGQPFS